MRHLSLYFIFFLGLLAFSCEKDVPVPVMDTVSGIEIEARSVVDQELIDQLNVLLDTVARWDSLGVLDAYAGNVLVGTLTGQIALAETADESPFNDGWLYLYTTWKRVLIDMNITGDQSLTDYQYEQLTDVISDWPFTINDNITHEYLYTLAGVVNWRVKTWFEQTYATPGDPDHISVETLNIILGEMFNGGVFTLYDAGEYSDAWVSLYYDWRPMVKGLYLEGEISEWQYIYLNEILGAWPWRWMPPVSDDNHAVL